jgi:hypothetical protein
LRLQDARVAEHQLDDADVDAVGEQPASAFVPQVMPAKIDLAKLFLVPYEAFGATPWLVAVRQKPERLPGCLDIRLIRAALGTEDERVRP